MVDSSFSEKSRESVPELVDHLFRHRAGQMVSALTRYFGVENLELVEDIVQEALLKALQQWPYRGIPENPGGWLWQTAKNQALDVLRREARFQKKLQGEIRLIELGQATSGQAADAYPFDDDRLSMMFIGCHPALSRESQIAFVLNAVSGFSAAEIARAFLVPEVSMAQRLVRAKARLRSTGARFELPEGGSLSERLEVVLEVLYLLFNEGYDAHKGEALVRQEICLEAISLGKLLTKYEIGQTPPVHALMALMCLQASRLPARTDADGNVVLLREQNRTLWDQNLLAEGLRYLELSAQGAVLSRYHIEASLAAKHATVTNYELTDWPGILSDYEALLEIAPSPVVRLNQAVAFAVVHGPEAGLKALLELREDAALQGYYLLHATLGELYERNGKREVAAQSYRRALALTGNEAEQRFLQKKLHQLENRP